MLHQLFHQWFHLGKAFAKDNKGDLIEWAIRIFVVVLVCLGALTLVGQNVLAILNDLANALSDVGS